MTEAESELLSLRRARVNEWTALGVDPFGSTFPNTERCAEASANFVEERPVRVAGRLTSKRGGFGDIRDETGKIQVYAHAQGLGDKMAFWKLLDIGDFIGGSGTLFTTKTGEKTVRLSELQILSKSLRPLPSQWYGLADVEQRYRQRYVDLIVNEDAKRVLLLRSKIVREIRNFMEERAFTEVETPMMQTIAGGAAANPFKTHHKALGIDLFLRIAPELYLKRLLVGGLTRIYEINRNFRNEGISRRHNPEFTMLEAYWAYADFEQMAELVENLIVTVAQKSVGTLQVGGREEQEGIPARAPIDLTPPFRRARYKDLVMEAAGADWFTITPAERRTRCATLGVEVGPTLEDYEVTNQVFEKLVEAKSHNPLFVTHLPKELVPLAKQNKEDPSLVDVFELIIGGQEVAPGYTELNDPITQRARLLEQAGEETQSLDEDFLHALEYGMPPAGGIGIGIDRLVMTLTGADSVRDVIYFPLLKPKV